MKFHAKEHCHGSVVDLGQYGRDYYSRKWRRRCWTDHMDEYLHFSWFGLLRSYFISGRMVNSALTRCINNRRKTTTKFEKTATVSPVLHNDCVLHLFYTDHCLFDGENNAIPIRVVGWNVQRDSHIYFLCIDRVQISASAKSSIFCRQFGRRTRRGGGSVSTKVIYRNSLNRQLSLEKKYYIFRFVASLTDNGLKEGLHNTKAKNRTIVQSVTTTVSMPQSVVLMKSDDSDGDDEEREQLILNRESSHEYD